jgi:hypothetical protein
MAHPFSHDEHPMSALPDSRTKLIFFLAWVLLWLLLVAVGVQEYWREGGRAFWQPVLWESTSVLVAALLLLLQRRFTRPRDALLATPKKWFALQFAWLPFNCIAFVLLTFGLRHAIYAALGQTYRHQAWLPLFWYESIKVSLLFAMANVVMFGVLSWRQLLQEQSRMHAANELLRQARLQQLTQQMQPHFLFNALNTISSLMYSDVDKADAVLMQLADVLRATLAVSEQQQVPLATELHLLKGYASLMCERFIDRVSIDWQIDQAAMQVQVPVMSLQPLLENIFKHTVEKSRQPTRIRISVTRMQGDAGGAGGTNGVGAAAWLCLTLEDDRGHLSPSAADGAVGGAGADMVGGGSGGVGASGGIGIGLKNVRARLQVLHQDRASLNLIQLTPCGVRAELRLPWSCNAHPDR